MKKVLLISVSLALSLFLNGQITFNHSFGGLFYESGYCVIQSNDGGYLVCGSTTSYGAGGSDVYIIKTNQYGDTLWTMTYGWQSDEYGYSVVQNENNEYVVCGYTSVYEDDICNIFLVCINEDGNIIWTKEYSSPNKQYGYSLIETTDSGYLITGAVKLSESNYKVLLIRTNSDGDTLWTRTSPGNEEFGRQSIQSDDNGFLTLGISMSNPSSLVSIYLIKTDEYGDTLWTKEFGEYFITEGTSITKTNDDELLIVGSCSDGGQWPNYDIYIVKIDKNDGSVLWSKTYGLPFEDEYAKCVQVTVDNGFIITGNRNWEDLLLIKTNVNGNDVWTQYFYGMGRFVFQTDDNGFILTGATPDSNGYHNVCLIKTDEAGILTSTNETIESDQIEVYPNPTGGFITIEQPGSRRFTLIIYSSFGNIVFKKLFEEEILKIDISNYDPGVYLLRFESDKKVLTRKIIKK